VISYTAPAGLVPYTFPDGAIWYKNKGVPIRSVSKILKKLYPMPKDLDPWYLERGKFVHQATVYIDEGTLGNVDQRIIGFCFAYQTFVRMASPTMEAIELTVVHPSLKFGARIDRVMSLPGWNRPLVVDIKCGDSREDRYWLQVAAGAMALDEDHVGDYDLALLNLNGRGQPRLTVDPDPASWINKWRKILQEDVA
jgi:hypothetical protein